MILTGNIADFDPFSSSGNIFQGLALAGALSRASIRRLPAVRDRSYATRSYLID
jgi:hypothetical protein